MLLLTGTTLCLSAQLYSPLGRVKPNGKMQDVYSSGSSTKSKTPEPVRMAE
ncbi:hypothetical protein PR003_g25211 [Phytophthora rubi]|uniref:Uncharacterized protein n=1 Tax=Phytophthora rubi TaxID=129364 RepID=A0A6A3IHS0_9STRA|nr:hypothetical protein PR001_g23921 [Phytophthora rubi]KAE9290746.1 hypothetical protein PR003_g25211 [Phytophthora rubi]